MHGVSYWRVEPAEAGQKLLQFLARRFDRGIPAAALQRWIRTGQVRVDGARAKPGTRLESGQEIRIPPHVVSAKHHPPAPVADLGILYETEDLLVLAKPAGLPVHPGSGHADSVSTRLKACYAVASWQPTPAHRLDRDTSGLLVVAKSYARLRELHELWRAGQVCKAYLAWVQGHAPWDAPTLITDLAMKKKVGRLEKMVVGEGQRLASLVQVIIRQVNASLVLIAPLTGRTHQIRVQLAGQGHPLLGDGKYGGPPKAGGMLLHAWYLVWPGLEQAFLPPWPPPWSLPDVISAKTLLATTRGLFMRQDVIDPS